LSKVKPISSINLFENIIYAHGTHEAVLNGSNWDVYANYTGDNYNSTNFNATEELPYYYNTLTNYSILPAWNSCNSLYATELWSGYNVFRGWFDMGGIVVNSTFRAYTYFNTTSLPININISSANISFFVDSCDKISGTDYNMSIWSDTGIHPIRPLNISEFYHGYYPNYCGIFNTNSYTVPKRYNIKLNNNGISEINDNGISKYVFRLGDDVYNNSWWTEGNYEGIVFSSPVLTVNYTLNTSFDCNASEDFLYIAGFDVDPQFLLLSIFFALIYFWWKSVDIRIMSLLTMLLIPYIFVVLINYALPLYITDANILLFLDSIFILMAVAIGGFTLDRWNTIVKAKKG
jgi:hypothetical protein